MCDDDKHGHHSSITGFFAHAAEKISDTVRDLFTEDATAVPHRDYQEEQRPREPVYDDDDGQNHLLDDAEEVEDSIVDHTPEEYEGIKPSSQFVAGPVLRFQDIDVDQRRYVGSALVVSDSSHPPRLVVRDPTKSRVGLSRPTLLDSWQGHHFYRYDIVLTLLGHRGKRIEYWFENAQHEKWNFHVPALDEAHNWAFYSCNGFTSDVEDPMGNFHGADPLWDDLLTAHKNKPFHTLVGGGDQIYNDDVLETPEMKQWLDMDPEQRIAAEFTSSWQYAVEKYYYDHYIEHFTTGTYSKVLSLIPSINVWDDHDIIDGYGSYPADIQMSATMQGIGAAATRFYLIFQQHSSRQHLSKAGLITSVGGKCFHHITHFGKRSLLVLPDGRSERSKQQILSPETYDVLDREIRQRLLPTTRHVIIVLGTPLVYPPLKAVEGALEGLGDTLSRKSLLGKIFGKYSAFKNVLGQFGPELLDDLVDGWACDVHTDEKRAFVELLQKIARERNVRVTFVGGDVHLCGTGRLYSAESNDPLRDPYHMTQIISSAIVNGPPPDAVVSTLHATSKVFDLNEYTKEEMLTLFDKDVEGNERDDKKMYNRRNWCEVRELEGAELEFTIRVENMDHVGTKKYPTLVQRLEPSREY
ncbi:hypothetical protein BGW41_004590 [Actinomortierella wolfii]|nr:hypothetical protein BGW41_004590 [Actinomortierella wolfii]